MKLVDDPRAAARRTAIRPGLAMMMAGALLLSPALALAERYQRVVRYSLNPDAFGWASSLKLWFRIILWNAGAMTFSAA